MDKEMEAVNHNISLLMRKNLVITGVKKIENFDDEEFFLNTIMGYMIIKGSDLEIVKLDTVQGNISIKGLINSISYMEDNKKNKEDSVFNRLFK